MIMMARFVSKKLNAVFAYRHEELLLKRKGNIYGKILTYKNLYLAYKKARKGKRNRGATIKFELELESNLFQLKKDLENKVYQVSPYNVFKIQEPKERTIMSLPFRDRIPQWLIVDHVLEPIVTRHFVYQNVACQKNKGTHLGLRLAGEYVQKQFNETKEGYILKCDISKYFYNIRHDILKEQLKRLIKDEEVLWLLDLFIDSTEGSKGIPIGNLTSQYFALLYLSELDHFIKEHLRIKYYVRYMDDFILVHHDKYYLKYCLEQIKKQVAFLGLELNSKTQIFPIKNGVDFLGFHTYVTSSGKIIRKLRKDSKKRIKRKLGFFDKAVKNGERSIVQIKPVIASWVGHAKHGNTYYLRKKIFDKYTF